MDSEASAKASGGSAPSKRSKARRIRILGFDPGLGRTGYGLIEVGPDGTRHLDHGLIETPSGEPTPQRLQHLGAEAARVIDAAAPDQIAVERLFFAQNVTTAMRVAEARGVLLAACGNVTVHEYAPLEIKQAVSAYGQAGKDQVGRMVVRLLKLSEVPKPDDVADALAVALCHAGRVKLPA